MPLSFMSLLAILDERFRSTHRLSVQFVTEIPDEYMYARPKQQGIELQPLSAGENILRSAGVIEQTFGGITTRLWDDPFEWTLPEKLFNRDFVLEYLDEVEVTRKKGFAFIGADDHLLKQIPAPVKIRPIFDIVLETLATAKHYQGRAFGILESFSHIKMRYN